jgi:hypothetical protein
MHRMLARTLGGLTAPYYFRHFIFGLAITGFVYAMLTQSGRPFSVANAGILLANSLLYPYARFAYESIVQFIVGENVFFANAVLFLAVKITMMAFCWVLAIFIAPIGLLYLFVRDDRKSS